MRQFYDLNAPKKPVNLSINSDLLARVKALKLNLSATLEHALVEQARTAMRDQWLQENASAINQANSLVSKDGLFADSYRVI